MKTVTTELTCDTCKSSDNVKEQVSIQVIFTTEQTEGRGCPPYLSMYKLDICADCMKYILKGNYVFGSGAQGYNTYTLKGNGY